MSKYKIVSGRTYDNRIHPFVVLGKDKKSSSVLGLKVTHSNLDNRNYAFKKNPNLNDNSTAYLVMRPSVLPYGYWADYSSYEVSKEDEKEINDYVNDIKMNKKFTKYFKK